MRKQPRLSSKCRPPFRRPFGTPAPQSKYRLQELHIKKAHLDSASGRFSRQERLFSLLNPTPSLTEKGDIAFMQSHSCQLKSGLSAHMTDSSFLAKCLFLSTGLPLLSKKAKFPATCPCSPRRRRVPTGGPRKTLCVRLLSQDFPFQARKQNSQPSAHIALAVGASRPEVRSQYGIPSLLAKHLFSPVGLPLPSRKQNSQPSAHIALTVGASRLEVRERRCASAF